MEIKVSELGNNYKDVFHYISSRKKKKKERHETQWKSISMVIKLFPLLQSQENYFKASDLWSQSLLLITS